PAATRPWQHVLDVLAGYLRYAEALVRDKDKNLPNALNFGPDIESAQPVRWILERVIETARAEGLDVKDWHHVPENGPVEAKNLALDASLSAKTLDWRPRLSQADAADWTARWHAQALQGTTPRDLVEAQITAYQELVAA
ncbi:MAG: CDP-glucose 4,6-dehydratase, partial [Rhodospirillaceae bacterium]|nr:CDP-glucose 4,6-dehydratase [Rhodospirillaceae bacterium]